MNEMNLDPGRQMLIRALYEELSAEELLAFEALLEEDAGLRADWEELRETRGLLASAASAAETESPFELALPVAPRGDRPEPHRGFRARLRAGLRSGWIPAWSFAGAAAALAVLLLAGFRVDRVDQGVLFHFGSKAPAFTASETPSPPATLAGGTESLDIGQYTPADGVTALPTAAGTDYLTRSDLDGYMAGVMGAVSELLGNYQQQQRGEMAFIYEQMIKEQKRDFERLKARVDGVGLGLMREQNQTRQRLEDLMTTRVEPESLGTAAPSEEGNHE